MKRWRSTSVEETRAIGRDLAAELEPAGALLLTGELGAGKTVLVQGLAEGLGIAAEAVQSPTFTLLAEHAGPRGRLLHFDLYRLEPEDVVAAGFEELLLGAGIKAVEWAERLPFEVPGARTLRISGTGDARLVEEVGSRRAAKADEFARRRLK